MNKPKVLVLCGKSSSGKTTTLNCLIKLLIDSGASIAAGQPSSDLKNDTIVVLNYRGNRIGIITAGDNQAELDLGLNTVKDNCDLYVFSCRTRGDNTRGWVHKTFPNAPIIFHMKWAILTKPETYPAEYRYVLSELMNDANQMQATGLKKHLDYYCDNN